MGDYGVSVPTNVRALSPVDLHSITNNQSLFQNSGEFRFDPNNMHHHDESNGIVNGINGGINGVHLNTEHGLTEKFIPKSPEVISLDEKHHTDSSDVNSVAVSLTQLGLTENNTNINNSIPTTLPSPSLWPGSNAGPSADDTCVNGMPGMNGGAITFQNFSQAPGTMLTPGLGLGPNDAQQQRRPITGQQGQAGNGIRPQQMFMNSSNKSYPAWSSAQQQQQAHGVWNPNMSPWNTQRRGLSQNVNPIGAPKKVPNSYILSPSKFRHNQFPGQMPMGGKQGLDALQGLSNEKDVSIYALYAVCVNTSMTVVKTS